MLALPRNTSGDTRHALESSGNGCRKESPTAERTGWAWVAWVSFASFVDLLNV
jgi:hypothetical protein